MISAPRMATYLNARGGNHTAALALYRWNMQISAAFLPPLQLCEIAVRNGVALAIQARFGLTWPTDPVFLRNLPAIGRFNDQDELRNVAKRHRDVGQIVAHLSFSFWQKRMVVRHRRDIWQPGVLGHFPGLPLVLTPEGQLIRMHDEIERVRNLRNRIAHHEPIFAFNLREEYDRILRVIGYRSLDASTWIDRVQTVSELLVDMP